MYEVVDADFHFSEDIKSLSKRFDEPWWTRLKEGGAYTASRFYPTSTGDSRVGGRIQRDHHPGPMGEDEIMDGMEKLGIDSILALSEVMLSMHGMHAADDRSIIMANGVADYLVENILDPENGIYSAIPVPLQEPEEGVEIIERVGDERGFVGIYLLSSARDPPLGHHKYDPLYEKAESEDLPVIFHASGSSLDDFHREGFGKFVSTHTLGFMESNLENMTSMLIQGLPEKFPDLDMVMLESGLFWIPALMYRLDAEYMKRPSEAPLLEKRPSKYMKERFYYGTQPIERPDNMEHLKHVMEMIGGPDQILFASDYPHWDFDHPRTITELPFLSEKQKAKILSRNAEEVFGL